MFFQGKCVADFSLKKKKMFFFKKVCNALSLEKHRESAKGTGKGTGREQEQEQEQAGGPYHPPLWCCHWACFFRQVVTCDNAC